LRAPERYAWIDEDAGFNPRGQQNSNALADFFVDDLRASSPLVDQLLISKALRKRTNADVFTKVAERNVDLALLRHMVSPNSDPVVAAVENKTIMTAHDKARKNRYGDLIAYCNHMHNHQRAWEAGVLIVINISNEYANPDPFAKDIQRAKFNMDKVVADTIRLFANIPLRDDPDEPTELPEALGIIVVDYDGKSSARVVNRPPAPQSEDAIHYDAFVRRMAELFD
jgi:hypothetical protein